MLIEAFKGAPLQITFSFWQGFSHKEPSPFWVVNPFFEDYGVQHLGKNIYREDFCVWLGGI